MRFHGYHKSAYFTHACGRCFPGATEATNNTEPVFVSESTCRPQTREQLAAPSNIHEWDGNTEGQCGAGDTGGEAASASVQRIMGLICITSGLLLFVRATVFCVCVCNRERGEQKSSSCHRLQHLFSSLYLRDTNLLTVQAACYSLTVSICWWRRKKKESPNKNITPSV